MIVEFAIVFLITSIGAIWFGKVGTFLCFILGLLIARRYKKKMNDHTDYKKIETLFQKYMGKKK